MEVKENVDLFPFNTFGMHVRARYLATVTREEEVLEAFASDLFRNSPRLILGGGSNVLFTRDFDGLVVRNQLTGIDIVGEDESFVELRARSGVNWHDLVTHCVARNYGGIENLSLIPGTVGAAPMQNIGAYGVEVREVITSVETIEMATGKRRIFAPDECAFGYRESVFKHELKNQHFISSITLRLTKKDHRINIRYGAIRDVLLEKGITEPTIADVSHAVIAIRSSKLPDPAKIGNAGSFFKNPTVDPDTFARIKQEYPPIPSFPLADGNVKVPAAWLIEQCGWKGKTRGNIGVHKHQALVLVNYGGGSGPEIWQLALEIQASVRDKFDINLHPEVNIID